MEPLADPSDLVTRDSFLYNARAKFADLPLPRSCS